MARKPSDKQRIIGELTKIKGIGPKKAARIYDKCGRKDCLNQIDRDPDGVSKRSGIRREVIEGARVTLKPRAFGKRPGMAACTTMLTDDEEIRREFGRHWQALQAQKQYCELVLAKHRDRLIARPDVTGLHVGLWRREGKIVCPLQYRIRVHIVEKLSFTDDEETLLAANSLMPTAIEKTLDGVRVDVLQQTYRLTNTLPNHASARANRLRGGVPISPTNDPANWGTLGMPVVSIHDGKRRYLTNAHVVGDGVMGADPVMQQPASETADSSSVIGEVKETPVLDADVDAASITPTGSRRSRAEILNVTGGYIARDLNSTDVDLRTRVFKVGATTGLTTGRVKSINATIDYGGGRVMTNQILVESKDEVIIQPGDSGSILCAKDEQHDINVIVGLVHGEAANQDNKREGFCLVASPISKVIDKLKIRFSA